MRQTATNPANRRHFVRQARSFHLIAGFVALHLTLQPGWAVSSPSWEAIYNEGKAALTQQKLDKAEKLLRQSLALVEKQSSSLEDKEKCMVKLAETLTLMNKTLEAQSIYQRLFTALTQRYGSNSPKLAPILYALGSIQEAAGNHSAAVDYYQKALNINEKEYGPYSPAIADNLRRLARVTALAGDRREGERHYKRAISILSADPSLAASQQMKDLMHDYGDLIKGDDDSNRQLIRDFQKDILNKQQAPAPGSSGVSDDKEQKSDGQKAPPKESMQPVSQSQLGWAGSEPVSGTESPLTKPGSLSSAWEKQSNFQLKIARDAQTDEAGEVMMRGISRPASDTALAPAFRVMNDTVFNQKHYEKGESYYKRIIAVDIDALGPNHPSVGNDLNGLAQLYIDQARYGEAIPLLERALCIYDQVYGQNNILTLNTRATLAAAEFRAGNLNKAAELYRQALGQGQSSLKPNSMETARILNELAYLYFRQGKFDESLTFYQWALASTEGAAGKDSPLTAACLKDYAQVLRSAGRTSDAAIIESRADKISSAGQ